ncbi:MAG TPA: PAS domain-containing protein, partial [Pyrinomonadaceae bacterium]|nr:PAS domain-containing protein [Pyrinomonadaceae bacterium]
MSRSAKKATKDNNEHKRTLEQLQAQKDLLDLAQKAARAMAFDWYIQQEINTWSPEQEALYGLAPGTFDGTYESWKKLVHPNDWPLVVETLRHAQQTGEISVEYRVVWPDGTVHWLAANGQMFFDEQGKPFRMVGFTADVTARKLVEEKLQRSAAFLTQAQHLSSTGSFAWRASTSDQIAWSDELYRIFDLDPATPITLEHIRARVHPDDLKLFDKTIEKARATGSDFEFQHRLLLPDNSIKYLRVVAQAIRDHDGELEYIAAVQDVTELRLSEEAIDKARSELAHVTQVMSLGALTASIAHEVNQPLSGIVTNASTCLRMLDADPPNVDGARETTRRTIRDAHRASDVITRLRALFGHKNAIAESVDLNEITHEVIALLRNELQRNHVKVHFEVTSDLPPVTADRIQLQQVILNLVQNASDAMDEVRDRPKQLLIKTERDEGDGVRLSVQDCGAGVDPESIEKLF